MLLGKSLWDCGQKKSLQQCDKTASSNSQLTRALTTWDLILFGIGAIIGAGLFSITGIAAAQHAGPAILISFVLAAFACAMAALCYSELAAMIPISGSVYTYTYVSFGEFPAWLVGWTLILEYAIGAATVAVSWAAYAESFLLELGLSLPAAVTASPWQPEVPHEISHDMGLINLPAFLIVAILSLLLITGIRHSALFNTVIVILKICAVAIFIGVGIFYINWSNYEPFIPENTGTFGSYGWSGILRATGIVFFAYIGFDAISTTALETKSPQKSIPRGIIGSLIICTVVYILFSFVLTGLVNYKDLNVAAPVALAISKTPFPWLHGLINLAILAGLTSVILVFLMGQSRIFYAMAYDGFLPKCFSELHPKWNSPWLSNLMLMVLVGAIAAFAPLSALGQLVSIGTLLAFTFACAAVMYLRYTQPDHPRPFKVPLFPIIPLIGMGACFAMMIFLGAESWLRLLSWMFIGVIIYWKMLGARKNGNADVKNKSF